MAKKPTTRGLRGKYSPMLRATDEQKDKILELVATAQSEPGVFLIEVRHPTYIGPGCAAEHGDITICVNGRIWYNVQKNGLSY